MSKGFVLTFDAMLAVIFSLFMMVVILVSVQYLYEDRFYSRQLYSIGNDILAVGDLSQTFNNLTSLGEQDALASLRVVIDKIPDNYCANITVEIYTNGGDTFDLQDDYYTDTGCSYRSGAISVKRIFVNYDEEEFGVSYLNVWLK